MYLLQAEGTVVFEAQRADLALLELPTPQPFDRIVI
jgi:hypothetical protein